MGNGQRLGPEWQQVLDAMEEYSHLWKYAKLGEESDSLGPSRAD